MHKKYILLVLIFMEASALGMQNRDGKRDDTNAGEKYYNTNGPERYCRG